MVIRSHTNACMCACSCCTRRHKSWEARRINLLNLTQSTLFPSSTFSCHKPMCTTLPSSTSSCHKPICTTHPFLAFLLDVPALLPPCSCCCCCCCCASSNAACASCAAVRAWERWAFSWSRIGAQKAMVLPDPVCVGCACVFVCVSV